MLREMSAEAKKGFRNPEDFHACPWTALRIQMLDVRDDVAVFAKV